MRTQISPTMSGRTELRGVRRSICSCVVRCLTRFQGPVCAGAQEPGKELRVVSLARVPDDAVAEFEAARGRLFGLAYRMLGSVPDAEDVVQETWLRWQRTDRSAVREPVAFLTTTATRIAINTATSAYARRTTYLGPWLPEPVDTSADPELGAIHGESVEMAVMVLLETLSPTQRAAYVLREAFGYSFREIGSVLDVSEASARQSASRARAALRRERPPSTTPSSDRRLLQTFLDAARGGDLAALESMLAHDVRAVSDGGGLVSAARVPVVGRERVARFLVGAAATFAPGTDVWVGEANGAPALVFSRAGRPAGVLMVDLGVAGIAGVYVVLNPDKLTGWAADLTAQ